MTRRLRFLLPLALLSAALLAPLFLVGCDVDDEELSVTREIEAYVQGVYRNNDTNINAGFLVANNSGSPVEQLDLRQSGSELQAIDNHGILFDGTLGRFVNDDTIEFELNGKTSVGNEATISGTIKVTDGKGQMRGTWIEPSLTSTVYGEATGPTIQTNAPVTSNLTIGISGAMPTNTGDTASFTASGGSGSYTWTLDAATGTLSPTQNSNPVTYQRTKDGNDVLRATDSVNNKASYNLTQ